MMVARAACSALRTSCLFYFASSMSRYHDNESRGRDRAVEATPVAACETRCSKTMREKVCRTPTPVASYIGAPPTDRKGRQGYRAGRSRPTKNRRAWIQRRVSRLGAPAANSRLKDVETAHNVEILSRSH